MLILVEAIVKEREGFIVSIPVLICVIRVDADHAPNKVLKSPVVAESQKWKYVVQTKSKPLYAGRNVKNHLTVQSINVTKIAMMGSVIRAAISI
jgi:hypothetical protein